MCRIIFDLFREFQFGIKHFLVSSAIYVRNSVTFIVSLLVELSTKNTILAYFGKHFRMQMPYIFEINCPIRAIEHCAFILRSFPPPFRFWLFVFMVLALPIFICLIIRNFFSRTVFPIVFGRCFKMLICAFSTLGLHKIKFLYSVGQGSFSFVSSCLPPNIEKHDKEYKANYFA